jgi:xylose isomerase
MEEHLRFAVCYWHSFAWDGFDIFGAGTMDRPWHPTFAAGVDPMAAAKQKMEAAFEFFAKLGVPFYCFHDRDIAPEGASFKESAVNLDEMVDVAAEHQQRTGVSCCGAPPTCSPTRATRRRGDQSRPEVFAFAAGRWPTASRRRTASAAQLRAVGRPRGLRDAAEHRHEARARPAGAVPDMVVEHKHAIGFTARSCSSPSRSSRPSTSTTTTSPRCTPSCSSYDLADEIKVNIEVNHATLAGHDFAHEIASRVNAGHLRLDRRQRRRRPLGWDVDRFPCRSSR